MVPGQVADEHPDACAEIAARGRHEIGYHGYHHESVLELPIDEERELMKRGIAALEETFDETPRGNRSPPFALGPNTADLLEEFGFAYDSSLFGHDEPYRPRVPDRRRPPARLRRATGQLGARRRALLPVQLLPLHVRDRDALAGARDLEGGVRRAPTASAAASCSSCTRSASAATRASPCSTS